MANSEALRGRAGLAIGHVVGMVDMVALPIWVGDLIQNYKFSPSAAGGLVTLFLVGVLSSSLLLAPRFHRINGRAEILSGLKPGDRVVAVLERASRHPWDD